MTKATYESSRKQVNRLTILKGRLNYLVKRQGMGTEGYYTSKEISALEWAIAIIELHLREKFGALPPERSLYASNEKRRVIAELSEKYGTSCYLCGLDVARADMSIDHVIPLAKGGTDVMDNYMLAHIICNVKKGNMTLDDFKVWQLKAGDAAD